MTRLKTILLLAAMTAVAACAQSYVEGQLTWPPPETAQVPPVKPPVMDNADGGGRGPSPGATASLNLRRQAVGLIADGRLEEAIRILERAVNLAPSDGVNYYYLAEAWRRKGNTARALEFNRLAQLYLGDSPDWQSNLENQRRAIVSP